MITDEEFESMIRSASACTLGLALALATNAIPFRVVSAASHCKGLAQVECGTATACKWSPERPATDKSTKRKAHCRLDVKAAGEIAAKIKSR